MFDARPTFVVITQFPQKPHVKFMLVPRSAIMMRMRRFYDELESLKTPPHITLGEDEFTIETVNESKEWFPLSGSNHDVTGVITAPTDHSVAEFVSPKKPSGKPVSRRALLNYSGASTKPGVCNVLTIKPAGK